MWPGTDPISVSGEPHLGQVLIGLRPAHADSALAMRVNVLERQLAQVEWRLLQIEIDRARPWFGARWWRTAVGWLQSWKERF